MQAALETTTTVHEGGKVEVIYSQLPANAVVEVIVLYPITDETITAISKRLGQLTLPITVLDEILHVV